MLTRRVAALIAFLIAVPVLAQTRSTFTFQQENDSYFSGTDRGYTNGTRLLWTYTPAAGSRSERIASWLCRGASAETCTREVSAGITQTMYTPANLERSTPVVGDRPYGGWLFGTMMFDAIRDRSADHVEISVGVVGPHSYAKQAQIFIHQHVTPQATDPEGWDNQIGEWAGVLASYERSIKLLPQQTQSGIAWFDVTPALGGAVGNVFVNATATTTVRLGYNLPKRFVPRSIQATPITADIAPAPKPIAPNWDVYVFGGGSLSYVQRNLFIDAEDSTYRISREPNVQSYRAGASVRVGRVRIAYQHSWRSAEFRAHVRRLTPVAGQAWDTILFSIEPKP